MMPRGLLGGSGKGSEHLVDRDGLGEVGTAPGRVLGVTGAGGAPGRTFLSLNISWALASEGLSVCLVEAGTSLGTVSVQLGLSEDRSLTYLVHEAAVRPLDDDLVDRHLQRSGPLQVLTGRFEPGPVAPVPPEVFDRVLAMLGRRHQLVVVDLGAMESPLTAALAYRCQTVCWVCAPTVVGADLFDRVLRSSLANPLRTMPSTVVLNGVGESTLRAGEASLLRRYGMPLAAAIPFNREACIKAEISQRPAVAEGGLRVPLRRAARAVAAAALLPSASVTSAAKVATSVASELTSFGLNR